MMANPEIYEKVSSILIKRFKIDNAFIREDANLENDLGLDSIELMDAIGFAEAEFKIKIIKKGTVNIQPPITVRDLVAIVSQRVKESTRQ